MTGGLYTIGYAGLSAMDLTDMLAEYRIDTVLDVRSVPRSAYAPQFDKDAAAQILGRAGVRYVHMGRRFGARPHDLLMYDSEGRADFSKIAGSEPFVAGLKNVSRGLAAGHRVALMCAEKDPENCHRAILVARAFSLAGIQARHIRRNGGIQTQVQLDAVLLDRYFPHRAQLSFGSLGMPHEQQLDEAYRMRGREIAYVRKNANAQANWHTVGAP